MFVTHITEIKLKVLIYKDLLQTNRKKKPNGSTENMDKSIYKQIM